MNYQNLIDRCINIVSNSINWIFAILFINVTYAVVSSSPIELGEQILTYETGGYNYEPSLINMADGRALLLWVNNNAQANSNANSYMNTTIYGQIYFSDGVPSGDKFEINQG